MRPSRGTAGRWKHLTRSISGKLIALSLLALLIIFGLLGYLSIRLHRKHLEAAVLGSAERISDVIHRSTTYYMMRNDRDGLYQVMKTIADEPGMVRVEERRHVLGIHRLGARREPRQIGEEHGDDLALAPWDALGEDDCSRLRALVRPWSKAIVSSGEFGLR